MPLLDNVLAASVTSKLIVVEDDVENDGSDVLVAVVRRLGLVADDVIHVFCTDSTSPNKFLKAESPSSSPRVVVHELYKDPLNWNGTSHHLGSDLVQHLPPGTTKFVVCIDSISPLLFECGPGSTLRLLQNLTTHCRNVVCLVHCDVGHDLLALERAASTVLELGPVDTLRVRHRFDSGKVHREVLTYSKIGDTFAAAELSSARSVTEQEQVRRQLASQLTFNVSLNEAERRQRSQLVLPYERLILDSAAGGVGAAPGGARGQIYYEPEDDEDPDDDLDL